MLIYIVRVHQGYVDWMGTVLKMQGGLTNILFIVTLPTQSSERRKKEAERGNNAVNSAQLSAHSQ